MRVSERLQARGIALARRAAGTGPGRRFAAAVRQDGDDTAPAAGPAIGELDVGSWLTTFFADRLTEIDAACAGGGPEAYALFRDLDDDLWALLLSKQYSAFPNIAALLPEQIEVGDQHQPVEDGDTRESDKSNSRRDAEGQIPEPKGENAARNRKRDSGVDEQSLAKAAQSRENQNEDESKRHGHHDTQPSPGLLEVLELATELDGVAFGKFDAIGYPTLRFPYKALHIPIAEVDHDRRPALAEFPGNGCYLLHHTKVGHLAEREQTTVVHTHRQTLEVIDSLTQRLVQSDDDVKASVAFDQLTDLLTGQSGVHHPVQFGSVQVVPAHGIPLGNDFQQR